MHELVASTAGTKRAAPDEDLSSQDAPARERSSDAQGEARPSSRGHKSRRTTPTPEKEEEHEQEPKPEPESKPQNTCGVCRANPPKYKCPRCYLPYCSVACNKIHRDTHPPDPEPKPQAPAVPPPPEPPRADPPAAVAAADSTNPFRALDTSEPLRMLFRKYPGLPAQLMEIHAATLPPREAPDKVIPASLMQGVVAPRRKDAWNHDVGIRNGKAALRRAKKDAGEAGEAIREYVELIVHVMGEAGHQRGDAPSYVQQQAAREDTKLIQQLMAEEQRKR